MTGEQGPNTDCRIRRFQSRADQLRARGIRNFGRFMTKTGPYTHPDPQERARLEREQIQDQQDDRDWNRRHGPVPGGASILQWRHDSRATSEEQHTAHARHVDQCSRSHADDR